MRYTLIAVAFLVQACGTETPVGVAEKPDVEAPLTEVATPEGTLQSFLRQRRSPRGVSHDLIPQIPVEGAFEMCRTVLSSGMRLAPILDAYGLPPYFNNVPTKKNATWRVAPNDFGITSVAVHYRAGGEIKYISFFGQGFAYKGGIVYWMDEDEYCRPGVKHESRARPRPPS